jgi:hypothetical protein
MLFGLVYCSRKMDDSWYVRHISLPALVTNFPQKPGGSRPTCPLCLSRSAQECRKLNMNGKRRTELRQLALVRPATRSRQSSSLLDLLARELHNTPRVLTVKLLVITVTTARLDAELSNARLRQLLRRVAGKLLARTRCRVRTDSRDTTPRCFSPGVVSGPLHLT